MYPCIKHPRVYISKLINVFILNVFFLYFLNITKIGREFGKNILIQSFKIPEIHFQATCYHQLINWKIISRSHIFQIILNLQVLEPTQTQETFLIYTNQLLKSYSQAVECHIKIFIEASFRVCGHDRRHGMVRSITKSRTKYEEV